MSQFVAVFVLAISSVGIRNVAGAADHAAIRDGRAQPPLGDSLTVECYTCVNCPHVDNQTNSKTCPFVLDKVKVKKCVTYAENYPQVQNNKNVSWVVRGCATERGSCAEIKKAYTSTDLVQLEYCNECLGDKCNGVSRSLPDMVFAFIAVVLTPILAKCTLS